ncbi:MAG: UDP-3-O-[3-hydroxymyristoyl] glucosamine N-acyltransferase [Sediminicola sp.]|jgi:UDP-3-O-[3-hydroxymyristoyl] glucosamine N-acyltransferase|tara:strand:- start:2233 stop:2883 length:651 start_codon:yes stop_codon:yes gene_type:complete
MKEVIIIGAGAHAAEIEEYILDNNKIKPEIKIIGYLDDSEENHQKSQLIFPLLGGVFSFKVDANIELILSIGNLALRSRIITHFTQKNIKFTNFIHHTSRVFRTVKLGVGNVFCPYTQIGPNVVIGNNNTFNNKSSIGHNSIIGDNNMFCPNMGLSGYTVVGNSNFFSLNVVTVPNIKVGNNNVIAPNMVIEKDIESDSVFFHRFKEVVLAIPKQE